MLRNNSTDNVLRDIQWPLGGAAAKHGHLHILKYLHSRGCSFLAHTCNEAAARGDLVMLKWLRSIGTPWDVDNGSRRYNTCANAARGGHLELLKWARANECEWDFETCANAAAAGRLDILRWARGNGCEWNSVICSYAAREGHLEVDHSRTRMHSCTVSPYLFDKCLQQY